MDLMSIRAREHNGVIGWEFVDADMRGIITINQPLTTKITEGDIWKAELVDSKIKARQRTMAVRLVARVRQMQPWEKISELPGHWMPFLQLKTILCWLNNNVDVILIGPKGTGKTTIGYRIAEALGWQHPLKVDVSTVKRTTDYFGTDAAADGSTLFIRSALFDYIERACIALQSALDTQFLVIMDEINRVHSKVNEALHGLFDDDRQITIITAEGSKTIKLPRNLHVIGTMNIGAEYLGIHGLDEALKDRFGASKVQPMPQDYEVRKLVDETGIIESQALTIVEVAGLLREANTAGTISFGPSYRQCRNTAKLVVGLLGTKGIDFRSVVIEGMLGWYPGTLDLDSQGIPKNPTDEVAKAYSALRMRGVDKVFDKTIAEVVV